MAIARWKPENNPYRVPMVQTFTAGSFAENETFIITAYNPAGLRMETAVTLATYTAGASDDATDVADAIENLLNNGGVGTGSGSGTGLFNHPYARAVEVTQSGAVVTVTAKFAGVPFEWASDTGTGTFTQATTTVNSGPNDLGTAGNWDTGSVPTTSDTVIISGTTDILYGLNDLGGVPATVEIVDYTGVIGTFNMPWRVYPSTEMVIDCNSSSINLLFGTAQTVPLVRVVNSGSGSGGAHAVNILVTSSGTITLAKVYSGSVRFYVPTITTLENSGADVLVDTSGQVTTLRNLGGYTEYRSADTITTCSVFAGTVQTESTCAITTVDVNGGTFIGNSTGTITTLNADAGLADFTRSQIARTITTLVPRGGEVRIDTSIVTVTNVPSTTKPYSLAPLA